MEKGPSEIKKSMNEYIPVIKHGVFSTPFPINKIEALKAEDQEAMSEIRQGPSGCLEKTKQT